jgi:hypothetical protein
VFEFLLDEKNNGRYNDDVRAIKSMIREAKRRNPPEKKV